MIDVLRVTDFKGDRHYISALQVVDIYVTFITDTGRWHITILTTENTVEVGPFGTKEDATNNMIGIMQSCHLFNVEGFYDRNY
jgi:hypothetical protein